jgi:hypothetical protein
VSLGNGEKEAMSVEALELPLCFQTSRTKEVPPCLSVRKNSLSKLQMKQGRTASAFEHKSYIKGNLVTKLTVGASCI